MGKKKLNIYLQKRMGKKGKMNKKERKRNVS